MKVSAVQYSTVCNNIHVYVSVELSNLDTRNMEMNKIYVCLVHILCVLILCCSMAWQLYEYCCTSCLPV